MGEIAQIPLQEAPSKADSGIVEVDYAAEKKLVRKLDLYIIPVVMLLYLLSFLDRSETLDLTRLCLEPAVGG